MVNSRQIIYAFILLLTLGFSGWYYVHNHSQTNDREHYNPADMDAFAEQVRVRHFNDNGQLKLELFTHKLTHYPKNNTTLLTDPKIIIYKDKTPPWVVTAKRGRAVHGNHVITLWNKVVLTQAKSRDNPATTIHTSQLTFLPDKHYLTTNQSIALTQPGIQVSSIGMHAYLNDNRIELLSKASGTQQGQVKMHI